MATIKRNKFSGIAPGISARLLNEEFGTVCNNADVSDGTLIPITENKHVQDVRAPTRSIYQYRKDNAEFWLQWQKAGVSAVHGPVPDDRYDRLYWTEPGKAPQMSSYVKIVQKFSINPDNPLPASSYDLGVAAPANAMGVSVPVDNSPDPTNPDPTDTDWTPPPKTDELDPDQTPDDVSYVYTLVTEYGEEGPPSKPTTSIQRTDNMLIVLNMPVKDLPPAYTGHLVFKRIYRSNTGSSSTQFQFLAELPITDTSYTDSTKSTGLGELCPSTYWIGPPNAELGLYPKGPMQGLIAVANGVLAGYSGNRLCLSEAYLPHAWPVAYRITLEAPIVAIKAVGNGLAVLTKDAPYFVTGTDPSAMTAIRIDLAQACINPESVVDMGDYILYCSPDGLCAVAGAEGQVVTAGLIPVRNWLDSNTWKPRILKAFKHEDTYVAFFTLGGGSSAKHYGWVYDPRGETNTLTTIDCAKEVYGGYHSADDGELYIINDKGSTAGYEINQYRGMGYANTSDWRTVSWKSKEYVQSRPVSFSWVQLLAKYVDYDIATIAINTATVKVYCDRNLIADYSITATNPADEEYQITTRVPSAGSFKSAEPIVRLPVAVGTVWQIEVSGQIVILEAALAQSIEELRAL